MAAAAAAATPPGPAAGPRRFSLLAIVGGGCHRPGLLAAALQQLERGEPRPRGLVSRPPHGSGPDAGSAALRPPRARGGGRREEILGAGSRWAAPRAAVVPGGCRLPGVGSRPSSMDLPRHLFRTPAFRPPLPPLLMQSVRPPRGRSGSAICPKSPRFAPGFVPAICPAPPPRSHLCPRGPLCAGTDVWWGGGLSVSAPPSPPARGRGIAVPRSGDTHVPPRRDQTRSDGEPLENGSGSPLCNPTPRLLAPSAAVSGQ